MQYPKSNPVMIEMTADPSVYSGRKAPTEKNKHEKIKTGENTRRGRVDFSELGRIATKFSLRSENNRNTTADAVKV